jgi:hypothetical protein
MGPEHPGKALGDPGVVVGVDGLQQAMSLPSGVVALERYRLAADLPHQVGEQGRRQPFLVRHVGTVLADDIEHVDPDGGRERRPLAACWSSRFERVGRRLIELITGVPPDSRRAPGAARLMIRPAVGAGADRVPTLLAVAQRAVTNVPLPLTVCTSPSARSTATALRTVWSAADWPSTRLTRRDRKLSATCACEPPDTGRSSDPDSAPPESPDNYQVYIERNRPPRPERHQRRLGAGGSRSNVQPWFCGSAEDIGERFKSPLRHEPVACGSTTVVSVLVSIRPRPAPFTGGHPDRVRTGHERSRTSVNGGQHCWKACWQAEPRHVRFRRPRHMRPREPRAVRRPAGPGRWGLRPGRDDHVPARPVGFGRHRRRLEMSWRGQGETCRRAHTASPIASTAVTRSSSRPPRSSSATSTAVPSSRPTW